MAARHPHFSLKQLACFDAFGVRTETALYEWSGKDFVLVPGADVTLGWAGFGPAEAAALAFWQAQLQELGIEGRALPFLLARLNPSPLRQVRIGPMLVECQPNEPNWQRVPCDSPELAEYQDEIADFVHGQSRHTRQFTLNDSLRLTRVPSGPDAPQGFTADLYREQSYEQLKAQLAAEGFALPTEDEWEYLCAAGQGTRFRWGDVVGDDLVLQHFDQTRAPRTLAQPNGLGLLIAHDPY